MVQTMSNGFYVYAVLGSGTALAADLRGFGGAPLAAVRWLDLAAVVSHLGAAPQPVAEHILQHEAVVEGLRRLGPALPMRFGTVLPDESAVHRGLADRYPALLDDLRRLGDKVELGLTVLWDSPAGHDGGGESADILLGTRTGPGTRYLVDRLVEHRQEVLVHAHGKQLAAEVHGRLVRLAAESRLAVLPTAQLLFRATYLLDPGRVEAFQQVFDTMRHGYQQLRFLLSGPWPPYSFVTPPSRPGYSLDCLRLAPRDTGGITLSRPLIAPIDNGASGRAVSGIEEALT